MAVPDYNHPPPGLDPNIQKVAVYNVGSKRDWVDDMVTPEDAMVDIEVDADIFYDYFLTIPQIKSNRRHKDGKQEWFDTLEVIATAIPDGLKWVETEKPDKGWNEIQNEGLARELALAGMKKEVEIKKKIWDSFQEANLINLSSDSYIIAGPRYFKPAVMEGEKKSKDLKEDVGNRGGSKAVKEIETCAAHYKRHCEAESTVTLLETHKKFQLFCGQFHEGMPKYIPRRMATAMSMGKPTGEKVIVPGTNVGCCLAIFLAIIFPVTISSLSNIPDILEQHTQTCPLTLRCGDQIPFVTRN